MSKKKNVEMMGKSIVVDISHAAKQRLNNRVTPLFIEMELYFSCLLRKQLRVHERVSGKSTESLQGEFYTRLSDELLISFRPVMTKSCSVSSCEGEKPPLSDFPIAKPQSYIPKWLNLDFKKGKWCGDFGY